MSSKAKPADLTLDLDSVAIARPSSADPNTSPIGVDLTSFGGEFPSNLTSLPPLPSSPPGSPGHKRDPSRGFLSNIKNRVAPEQEHKSPVRRAKDDGAAYRPSGSSMSKIYHLRKNPGSTPELSLVESAESITKHAEANGNPRTEARPAPVTQHHSDENISSKRRDKPFRNPLARHKSIRRESHSKSDSRPAIDQPPKTAPLAAEWSEKDMHLLKPKHKKERGKSTERAVASESDENDRHQKHHQALPQTKEKEYAKGGSAASGKNVASKAKAAGGGLLARLGKIGRSGSGNAEKEIPDSEYVCKVIVLPLVEQTRITRISKNLTACRDKTEYWMPSLPWRSIDYLNMNCESEGLYRVPGSGPQVNRFRRRFDSEHDVDLLDEPDLYDPNIIASMLKQWLRDLPEPILPHNIQEDLARELAKDNPDFKSFGQPVPQKLRDALSELPPFNYYLLFAITCHLSLLLSHKDKNKMDLHNLNICIGSSLRLDHWLFNYLVGDWRHCWQGCFTEKQYVDVERAWEERKTNQQPGGDDEPATTTTAAADERAASSSGSSAPASRDDRARGDAPPEPSASSVPETYQPTRSAHPDQINGGVHAPPRSPPAPSHELKRPSTAGEEKSRAQATKPAAPKHPAHNRTKSDLPSSPVQGGPDFDFPFTTARS